MPLASAYLCPLQCRARPNFTAGPPTGYRQRFATYQNNLGNLLRNMSRRAEAEVEYCASLALREKLAADFPTIPHYRVDLGGSYCNLGNLLTVNGRASDALAFFDKAVAMLTTALERDPRSLHAKQFLRNSFEGRARTYSRLQKPAEAEKDWVKVFELTPTGEQRNFRASRANSRVHCGNVAEAIAEIAELTKESGWNAGQWYDFASSYAVASTRIADKRQEYADRAMESLAKTIGIGYSDLDLIKSDAAWDSLRDRADFKKLLADLEKKFPPKPAAATAKPVKP
jgi:eukaryotic-like serine/threonine-protein kinase